MKLFKKMISAICAVAMLASMTTVMVNAAAIDTTVVKPAFNIKLTNYTGKAGDEFTLGVYGTIDGLSKTSNSIKTAIKMLQLEVVIPTGFEIDGEFLANESYYDTPEVNVPASMMYALDGSTFKAGFSESVARNYLTDNWDDELIFSLPVKATADQASDVTFGFGVCKLQVIDTSDNQNITFGTQDTYTNKVAVTSAIGKAAVVAKVVPEGTITGYTGAIANSFYFKVDLDGKGKAYTADPEVRITDGVKTRNVAITGMKDVTGTTSFYVGVAKAPAGTYTGSVTATNADGSAKIDPATATVAAN